MAGGLKVDYFQPIKAGDTLTSVRTLSDIYEKQGSSGPLIFYEVIMTVVNESGDPVLTQKTTRIMR
jgi:3-methylfumaryl-CoA hydratase